MFKELRMKMMKKIHTNDYSTLLVRMEESANDFRNSSYEEDERLLLEAISYIKKLQDERTELRKFLVDLGAASYLISRAEDRNDG